MAKKFLFLLVLFLFLIIGILIGFFSPIFFDPLHIAGGVLSTTKQCPYHYINSARCEPDLINSKKEYVGLQAALLKYIAKEKKNGTVTQVAVYFRDLENGPSIDLNDQLEFTPASLLKLPLMMSYYKKAEDDPSLLDEKITIPTNMQVMAQEVQPEQTAKLGGTYTINDLINLMIVQSDNVSWTALLEYLEKNYPNDDFVATLNYLGIIDPTLSTNGQMITVESYAAIFRLLYNSSYLNIPMSNQALKLLSQSDFDAGIVGGLPSGIEVAHKFGEREAGSDQQLHDCGIVYYQPDPYILCVMTRGKNISNLAPVIQSISQQVYNEVQSRT